MRSRPPSSPICWRSAGAPGAQQAVAAAPVVIALVSLWSLNLYNFMDGSDGLAALMGAFGFAAYAAVAQCAGANAALLWALAAGILPLLWANRPPARLFLGDVGAVPLGFLAAALGFGGMVGSLWPAWFPPLVFLPFIADATMTLARRVLRARADLGGASRPLLPAAASTGRGTPRYACGIRRVDGRDGVDRGCLRLPAAALGAGCARRLVHCVCAVVRDD